MQLNFMTILMLIIGMTTAYRRRTEDSFGIKQFPAPTIENVTKLLTEGTRVQTNIQTNMFDTFGSISVGIKSAAEDLVLLEDTLGSLGMLEINYTKSILDAFEYSKRSIKSFRMEMFQLAGTTIQACNSAVIELDDDKADRHFMKHKLSFFKSILEQTNHVLTLAVIAYERAGKELNTIHFSLAQFRVKLEMILVKGERENKMMHEKLASGIYGTNLVQGLQQVHLIGLILIDLFASLNGQEIPTDEFLLPPSKEEVENALVEADRVLKELKEKVEKGLLDLQQFKQDVEIAQESVRDELDVIMLWKGMAEATEDTLDDLLYQNDEQFQGLKSWIQVFKFDIKKLGENAQNFMDRPGDLYRKASLASRFAQIAQHQALTEARKFDLCNK